LLSQIQIFNNPKFADLHDYQLSTSEENYIVNGYLKAFGYPSQVKKTNFLPENMFYCIAMKATTKQQKIFSRGLLMKSFLLFTEMEAIHSKATKAEKEKVALTPKTNYCAVVLNCKGLVSISKIAKDYGTGF